MEGQTFDGDTLLTRFTDLNGSHFDTLDNLPTALEFSQLLRIARPVLIKGK